MGFFRRRAALDGLSEYTVVGSYQCSCGTTVGGCDSTEVVEVAASHRAVCPDGVFEPAKVWR